MIKILIFSTQGGRKGKEKKRKGEVYALFLTSETGKENRTKDR